MVDLFGFDVYLTNSNHNPNHMSFRYVYTLTYEAEEDYYHGQATQSEVID